MIIKAKKIFIAALCSSFLLFSSNGYAGVPKTDVGGAITKAVESVSRFTEKVSEKFKNIARTVNEKVIGFANKEIGPLKNNLVSKFNAAKDKFDGVKDKVDDAKDKVEEKLDPVKDKVNEGKDFAKDVINKVEEAGDASGVDPKKAQELAKLQLEKEKIMQDYSDKISASNETYDSSIKLLSDNIATYNQELTKSGASEDRKLTLNEQVASLGEQKSTKVSEKASAERDLNEEKTTKIKEIDSRINPLAKEVGSSALAKAEKYFGSRDASKSMENIQEKVFLAEDDPVTSENIAKVTRSRRAQAFGELVNSMNVSMNAIVQIEEGNKTAKEYHQATEVSEGQNTSISMSTSIKIEEIKAHLRYLKVAVAESKFKTSSSLAKIHDYNVSDQARDITKFNFDDYNYQKHCK